MTKRTLQFLCVLMALQPVYVSAQQSARFRPGSASLFQAEDMAGQKLYALAAQNARASLYHAESGIQPMWASAIIRARYINAISGLKISAPHCLDSALVLMPQLSATPLHDRLSLAIGQYYFLKGKLIQAIPYYESAGIANLDNGEIADAKFELAYAYFNNRQFVAANTLFAIMKEVPGKYYSAGNYYFGLLAYNEGDFEAALKSFDRINNEPVYRPVVPYYMAEIYYFMGNREKALSEALRLLKRTDKLYYDNELHLLAAQCLFEGGRYGEALPYFEYYYEHTDKIRKEELYEIGYSYYRVNEWKSAIAKFKPLSATQDSLGQTAMYLLGDCYLKNSEKENARNAFGICSNMPYNNGQREASLLLYAKLSYELGYVDDAMRSVRSLLNEYASGKYNSEARLLLSQIYLETSNFEEAYKTLAEFGERGDSDYVRAKQRAAYGYAMQEIQKQHLEEALLLLDVAILSNVAPQYTSAALFWKSELCYRLHRPAEAIEVAQKFLATVTPVNTAIAISPAATKEHASLTLGYAAMELKDFKQAQQAFSSAKSDGNITANASLREADALFMQKDFAAAAPLYAELANGKGADAEYARLQSATIAGLRGDNTEKSRLLQALINGNPASQYASEARYESGVVQLAESKYSEAIATLLPLVSAKTPAFAAKALLKIGTAQQQLSQDEKAIATYTAIIRDWPASPERSDALSALKSIYISRNQPEAYSKLLQDYHLPQASEEEMNAAYYNAAEAQYAAGKWAESQSGFARYLALYPSGASAGKARYYLANSYYNQKNYKAARASYDTLLRGNWEIFSDESVKRAAELAAGDSAYVDASHYYALMAAHSSSGATSIQAYIGLMRSAGKLQHEDEAALFADTLLRQENLAPSVRDEAKMYILRRSVATGRQTGTDTLIKALQESPNAAIAAEARYYAAQGLMKANKLKEAETAASSNIKKSAGNDYWVIKTYLLLADILVAEKDYFNARATLQSVAQHASIPELKEEAKKKLEDLKVTEGSKLSND